MSIIKKILVKSITITRNLLLTQKAFEFFQRVFSIHVMSKGFYSPIPDTQLLDKRNDIWEHQSELVGIDINIEGQLDLLENGFSKFQHECEFPLDSTSLPHEYYINNGAFGFVSAATLHCMVRHIAPRIMVEVGSGNSTYVSANASLMNAAHGQDTKLISIEPYPNQVLRDGFPGLTELIQEPVQNLDLDFFSQLREGDVLFIDSSHVVRLGGDVPYLYLEVLPRLNKGVVVHVHDIFFPGTYHKHWVIENRWFWTEQYLLQAFLTYNNEFEVLWCGSYIYLKYLEKLKAVFPPPEGLGIEDNYFSSSFWMRRV